MRFGRNLALLTTFTLSACGKPLGTYEVRDVKLVPGEALDKIEPSRQPAAELLRIEFTSATDMYEASDGGGEGLYAWASFCPYDENRRLRTFGPYYNDRIRYGQTYVISRTVDASGKTVETGDIEKRRPVRDARTGQYTYTAYLDVAAPADQWGNAYDLRRQISDVCLRIDHPGYFVTPSRSRVFKIPAAMIRAVLLQRPSA